MSTAAKQDRRALIAEAAIDIIAARGVHALSHGALDTELGLPKGSTSYYYRTRQGLLEAIVAAITTRSKEDFAASGMGASESTTPAEAAGMVAGWLLDLMERRPSHVIARYALLIELSQDATLHGQLAHSLFSTERAEQLFEALGVADTASAASGFVSVIEGVVFDRLLAGASLTATGRSRADRLRRLARPLEAYLVGVLALE